MFTSADRGWVRLLGLRLRLLAWWTPEYIIKRELDHVSKSTTSALRLLLSANSPSAAAISTGTGRSSGSVEEQRTAMAREHAALVDALVEVLGRDKAVRIGRASLFELGRQLGEETRARLGIGKSRDDLVRAAKVLYLVLGIEFSIDWLGETRAILIVNRCELAREYSELTCQVLSAIDEGVIRGVNPSVSMTFRERMTSGCRDCRADIEISQQEAVR
jgi:predicted ArsR family transcriptional regulator